MTERADVSDGSKDTLESEIMNKLGDNLNETFVIAETLPDLVIPVHEHTSEMTRTSEIVNASDVTDKGISSMESPTSMVTTLNLTVGLDGTDSFLSLDSDLNATIDMGKIDVENVTSFFDPSESVENPGSVPVLPEDLLESTTVVGELDERDPVEISTLNATPDSADFMTATADSATSGRTLRSDPKSETSESADGWLGLGSYGGNAWIVTDNNYLIICLRKFQVQ